MLPHDDSRSISELLDPLVEQDDSPEHLSDTPAASIIHGKAADDLKQLSVYALLRNAAMRHAHICQLFSHKLDGNVVEQLVEEAVTEVLLAHRKHWRTDTLKRNVRRALDRIVKRWKKRVEPTPDDTEVEEVSFDVVEGVPDPRFYEHEIIEQVDCDRALTPLRQRLSELISPGEWTFLQRYLDRDKHDPPASSAERVRFSRLIGKLRTHLRPDFQRGLLGALMERKG